MLLSFFNKKKSNKGLIGVDIQPHRVAIAHVVYGDNFGNKPDNKPANKPKLKQCVFEDVAADVDGDIGAVTQTVSKVAKSFPVSQFFCNSSIDDTSYELLLTEAPNVESSELKQAVRWRIKDQLSYHIDDAVIDVFEIPGQQSARAQLMYVVAAQQQNIERRVGQLKQAGMDLQSIDIYELAQRNIAAILPEDKEGVVILHLNENSGLLTITRNGVLFLTRNIDFGVNRLATILDTGLDAGAEIELSLDELMEGVENDDNETLTEVDIEPQSDAQTPVLNEQGKLIIDEVILEIQRSLDYYVSHFNQRPVNKVILVPLVIQVPGAIEYINEMLGIKAEMLDFNQHLDIAKPLSRELQARCFVAIGLALRQEV